MSIRSSESGGALGRDQLVGSGDLDEGDGHLAMLGLAARRRRGARAAGAGTYSSRSRAGHGTAAAGSCSRPARGGASDGRRRAPRPATRARPRRPSRRSARSRRRDARSSSSKTRVAAGPATSSSRCGVSVRKKWHRPEWTPADMRSSTGPTELSALPIDSIVHCMSEAAPAARAAWRSPSKKQQQRVAAELEHVAAVPLGDLDQAVEAGRDPLDELLGARLALRRRAARPAP